MKKEDVGKSWRIEVNVLKEGEEYPDKLKLCSVPYNQGRPENFREDYPIPVAEGNTVFDELVIDNWFHLEQMDDGVYWMRLGDARIDIVVDEEGKADLKIDRGAYGKYES
jgi:hypothetical protein